MSTIALFEQKHVRRAWNQAEAKWYFAIVDVVAVLTDSNNPQVYWRVMKKRLTDEGSETVTKCNALKMTAADAKAVEKMSAHQGTDRQLATLKEKAARCF